MKRNIYQDNPGGHKEFTGSNNESQIDVPVWLPGFEGSLGEYNYRVNDNNNFSFSTQVIRRKHPNSRPEPSSQSQNVLNNVVFLVVGFWAGWIITHRQRNTDWLAFLGKIKTRCR